MGERLLETINKVLSVDEARCMYAKAGEPKKLVIIPGVNHGDVYEAVNPDVFGMLMKEALRWYDNHLK